MYIGPGTCDPGPGPWTRAGTRASGVGPGPVGPGPVRGNGLLQTGTKLSWFRTLLLAKHSILSLFLSLSLSLCIYIHIQHIHMYTI